MAQHIGGSPYGITQRAIPITFRCDVAMSGRLGMELQPKHMNDEERSQCTTAFADYKALRGTVQTGNLYRLMSPYDRKGISSLMYVNDSQSQAVLFIYKVDNYQNQPLPRFVLDGLDAHKTYTLKERNVKAGSSACQLDGKQFTGEYLMKVGLEIPLQGDYASRVFELK